MDVKETRPMKASKQSLLRIRVSHRLTYGH